MPDKWTETIPSESYKNTFQRTLRDLDLIVKKEKYEFEKKDNKVFKKRNSWWYEINQVIDNPYLLYHHLFVPGDEANNKKEFLIKFTRQYEAIQKSFDYPTIFRRSLRLIENYESQGYKIEKSLVLQTDWRLIVGLGSESVLETSISLHPLYGFPYIPGSAIKGIARSFALMLKNKDCEQDDIDKINKDASIDAEAKNIFGTQEQAGKVIFFDAIPYEQLPELKLDIMNNHYGDYYADTTGKVPPGDWMNPNPIFFITIAPEQKFLFFLTSRDQTLLDKAKEWLEGGLRDLGAGGKTSAGYGYFVPLNSSVFEISAAPKESGSRVQQSQFYKEAEIIDADSKPVKVKILESGEIVTVGKFNPKGLGLTNGSKILVEPTYDKKTKKIQSVQYKRKAD